MKDEAIDRRLHPRLIADDRWGRGLHRLGRPEGLFLGREFGGGRLELRRIQPQSVLLRQMRLDARSLALLERLVVDDHLPKVALDGSAPVERFTEVSANVSTMSEVRRLVSSFEWSAVVPGSGNP